MLRTYNAPKVISRPRKRSGPAMRVRLDDPEVGLMLRVQKDDANAFAELLQTYWRQVFGRFFRRLGDRQEAEDLAQDVFLRLFRYRKRYEPRAKFATWLFHIAQNVLRNALRSRRRHARVRVGTPVTVPDDAGFADGSPEGPGDSPSRPMEQAEIAILVRAAVSGLGARQRAALEMHQFQDRTCAEIAEEMDMSPKAAKSLLYRARHQLRDTLGHCREYCF
jgi:RNA polymerase sigma-70 factor, ECF subfamily